MYLSYKSFYIAFIVGLMGLSLIGLVVYSKSSRTVVATSTTSGGKIELIPLKSTTPIRGIEETPANTSEPQDPTVEATPTAEQPEAAAAPAPAKSNLLKAASAEKPIVTQVNKTAPAPAPAITCSGNYVNEFLCLLNKYRASKGKGKVSGSAALSAVALGHSSWMNTTGNFSHEGINGSRLGDRCASAKISCRAENLAYNVSSAQKVLDMWIASPSHNTNLLGNYKTIGIGVSGSYTTLLFN